MAWPDNKRVFLTTCHFVWMAGSEFLNLKFKIVNFKFKNRRSVAIRNTAALVKQGNKALSFCDECAVMNARIAFTNSGPPGTARSCDADCGNQALNEMTAI